ncbi:Crp/Fnr family transcriptional regulator [Sphingobium sp. AN558]|uniref:Crp/Fnr family transcriptional regulator n=1 Tax=Sphingobium sp. AN558 TaxID=3133442 RepID=UPI0030BC6AA1
MSGFPQLGLTLALAKLERRAPLQPAARKAFMKLDTRRRSFAVQKDIVREGDTSSTCLFLESGVVSGSKMLPSGGRQIVVFHVAGDLLGLASALLIVADHSLRAHVSTVVLAVAHADILRLAEDFPEIGRAFWFETLVDASIFREWNLNLGRRGARERLAHLIMEIGYKLEAAGIDQKADYAFPITQIDLADALGLTPVHVNRCIQWLRSSGYIENAGRRMVIPDWGALADFASFRPLYMHPEGPRALTVTSGRSDRWKLDA